MANIQNRISFNKPSFDSLPLQKDGPPGNAWGLFGDRDQLGMLNLLTTDTTIAATKDIVHGIRISTDLPLNFLKTPMFKRQGFHQDIIHKTPRTVNDDVLTFNTQSSSQWDGFRHFGWLWGHLIYVFHIDTVSQATKKRRYTSMGNGRKTSTQHSGTAYTVRKFTYLV